MITYTDKNGKMECLNKEDLIATKDSIYFTSLYTQGGTFRCVDEFGDYSIAILNVIDDKYVVNVWDNWHLLEDVDAVLSKEELISFITEGGY